MKRNIKISGMTCVICKNTVEKGVNKLEGVNECVVNLLDDSADVDFDENIISIDKINDTINSLGYKVYTESNKNTEKIKLIITTILTIILFIYNMFLMNNMDLSRNLYYLEVLITLIVFIVNRQIFIKAFNSIKTNSLGMDVLVSLSSIISFIYSLILLVFNISGHLYFETGSMVIFFVSIGKYIEHVNLKKTVKTIKGLSTLKPMFAYKVIDGKETKIAYSDIKKRDILLVKNGETIPTDGIIVEGICEVDESLITGESLPLNKKEGDEVIGGSILTSGLIKIEVNKNPNSSMLNSIITSAKNVLNKKTNIQLMADIIAKYFVYVVISISIITFIIWLTISKDIETSIKYALSVLIISCPCSFGIATPCAIACGVSSATKNSILIKDPSVFENMPKIKTIILDKTGTITENKLIIKDNISLDNEYNDILFNLESKSNHPIAKTIISNINGNKIDIKDINELSGYGIIGNYNNEIVGVGNKDLLIKYNIKNNIIEKNGSYLYTFKDNKLIGYLVLQDKLKDDSIETINKLKNNGLYTVLASGDSDKQVKLVSQEVNIDKYYSRIKPQDKLSIVEEYLNNGAVAMVGDGINDVTALNKASVSISMSNGSDITSNCADVVLLDNKVSKVNFLLGLSKYTKKIIKENIFWALFYNALLIPIAAGVLVPLNISLNPSYGAISMLISSIIVISNALRILKYKEK